MLLEKWQVAEWDLSFCSVFLTVLHSCCSSVSKAAWMKAGCVLTLAPPPPWQVSRFWTRKRIFFVTLLKKLSGFWVPDNRREGSIRSHFLSMNGHSHQESCSSLLRPGTNLALCAAVLFCYLPSVLTWGCSKISLSFSVPRLNFHLLTCPGQQINLLLSVVTKILLLLQM